MADAMLSGDFKSSRPDLVVTGEQCEAEEAQKNNVVKAATSLSSLREAMGRKKSVDFTLEPPLKRLRGEPWSPKQVVDGKSLSKVWQAASC
jgi:hypothetical protein